MMKTGTMVKLVDGREVDSASEEWRHECEARHVAKMEPAARSDYLSQVAQKRGTDAYKALELLAQRVGRSG